jgi:3,4-dihydroxy-2-butanone 4-phosphate synthase
MAIASIETVLADLRAGRFVIIVDDEDRENEGDLAIAAEYATPQAINFMAREGRGLICVAMTGERLDALQIPLIMPPETNTAIFRTAFTVPVEARHGVTTGISAFDRATTIRTLINPDTRPEDLVRPGHVFPLRSADGGVLSRAGHTEASVDLARMAGLYPAAVICEIMRDDGAMARRSDLERFAARHGIRIVAIADLIAYRRRQERDASSFLRISVPHGDPSHRSKRLRSRRDRIQIRLCPLLPIRGR